MFAVVLALSMVGLQSQHHLNAQVSHLIPMSPAKLARPETIINFANTFSGSAYDLLLSLAINNRVPLGILRDRTTEDRVCNVMIDVKAGDITLSALTKLINKQVINREVVIVDGTITFRPKKVRQSTVTLLNTVIPEFHSNLTNHDAAGVSLWFYVRSVIAPGEATAYAGGAGSSSENITVLPSKAHTLERNMDLIVTEGYGGAWVLEASGVTGPIREVRMPYHIYDYNGDEQGLKRALSCQPYN